MDISPLGSQIHGILISILHELGLDDSNCEFCTPSGTVSRQLSKRLLDNGTIFAAEATARKLALDYYRHMDPVQHDVVVYSDSCRRLKAKVLKTLSFAILWTYSGHWVTKALVPASAGCQTIVALGVEFRIFIYILILMARPPQCLINYIYCKQINSYIKGSSPLKNKFSKLWNLMQHNE